MGLLSNVNINLEIEQSKKKIKNSNKIIPGIRIISELEQPAKVVQAMPANTQASTNKFNQKHNTKNNSVNENKVVAKKKIHKLKKLILATAVTFVLQIGAASFVNNFEKVMNNMNKLSSFNLYQEKTVQTVTTENKPVDTLENTIEESNDNTVIEAPATVKLSNSIVTKTEKKPSRRAGYVATQQDIEDLARMLYGEAGRGADPFEVLHTVFNRFASPYFKGNSLSDIVRAPGQYVGLTGYDGEKKIEDIPLTEDYLTMVKLMITYAQAHDWEEVENCDRYYFLTGVQGKSNNFEISPKGSKGRWQKSEDKAWAGSGVYCDTAHAQWNQYCAIRDTKKATTYVAAMTK